MAEALGFTIIFFCLFLFVEGDIKPKPEMPFANIHEVEKVIVPEGQKVEVDIDTGDVTFIK